MIRKRTVTVNRSHPTSSGFVDTVKVTVPCEPWETPDPVALTVVAAVKPNSPEAAVLAAVKAGKHRFDDIVMTAFNSRSGPAGDKCRKALRDLKDRGVLTCEQIPGKAMKWELRPASF